MCGWLDGHRRFITKQQYETFTSVGQTYAAFVLPALSECPGVFYAEVQAAILHLRRIAQVAGAEFGGNTVLHGILNESDEQ